MTLIIILIAVAVGLGVFVFGMRGARTSPARPSPGTPAARSEPFATPELEGDPAPFETEATVAVFDECFKLAFSVQHFDYNITGQHADVLAKVNENAAAAVHQREYFPRRPMLLPRLMQVLNDDDSTRNEMVGLILEDPALTGSVLQRANSAAYRYSPHRWTVWIAPS